MVIQDRAHQEGFSLTELMVVLILMGVLFAASYAGIMATYQGREVSDRQAYFAREVSTPLSVSEKILSQAITIENAGEYTLTVLTDRDNDKVLERHTFTVDAQGRFVQEIWLTNSARVNTSHVDTNIWSTNIVNIAESQPLFYYYGSDLARIEDMALVADDVRSVDLNIAVKYDDVVFRGSRTIFFRNR